MSLIDAAKGAPALEIVGLHKNFGALKVTQDVNLTLQAGARHALIGPNGAGKTTLVNQITGVLKPNSGAIRLFGTDITSAAPERRVALGVVRTFQIISLFLRLTVAENIGLAVAAERSLDAKPWGSLRDDDRVIEGVHELLERLNLMSVAQRTVRDLGYGQRRLVEIALALALKPKVLLLDEPAAGVSSRDLGMLLDILARLPADIAVLVIEHDMSLVFRFAQRITVLVGGAVLVEGSVEEVRANQQVRDVYLGRRGNV
ncbi:MAG TPA: ABC transporter ATP-binding protein [Stellaceae bacterium]|jgi:branched-chain amino acid transport system ATP-binding protein|nr:ABC transporter ATP-binding protein [Stellaceae bacterium]